MLNHGSETNSQCPDTGILTSPRRSSAAPVWISAPQSHSHCGFPVPPQAAVRCPALPVGEQMLPQTPSSFAPDSPSHLARPPQTASPSTTSTPALLTDTSFPKRHSSGRTNSLQFAPSSSCTPVPGRTKQVPHIAPLPILQPPLTGGSHSKWSSCTRSSQLGSLPTSQEQFPSHFHPAECIVGEE